MNPIRRNLLLLATAFILLVNLAACGPKPAASTTAVPLTEQQVTGVIENMLNGYNAGDYAAFSRDLSSALKLVLSEKLFQAFVTESETTLGKFQSITSLKQAEANSSHSSWVVTAQFANSSKEFNVTFDKATAKIEGMDFGPAH